MQRETEPLVRRSVSVVRVREHLRGTVVGFEVRIGADAIYLHPDDARKVHAQLSEFLEEREPDA